MDPEEQRRRNGGENAPDHTPNQGQPPQQNVQRKPESTPAPADVSDIQDLQRLYNDLQGVNMDPARKRAVETAIQQAIRSKQQGNRSPDDIHSFIRMPALDVPQFQNAAYSARLERLNKLIASGGIDTAFLKGDLEFFQTLTQDTSLPVEERNNATQAAEELVKAMQALQQIEQMRVTMQQSERSEAGEREQLTGTTGIGMAELIQIGPKGRRNREKIFNDILMEVDATPNKPFQEVFSIMTSPYRRYETLKVMLLSLSERGDFQGTTKGWNPRDIEQLQKEAKEDLLRFEKELNVRKVLHDALQVIYNPSVKAEQIFDYVQGFSSEDGEYAFKMTGVKEMMDLYEAGLRQVMLENNGYLLIQDVLGKVEKKVRPGEKDEYTVLSPADLDTRVKKLYRELYQRKKIRAVGANGESYMVGGDNDIQEADIDKIFTIARGMMVTSLRLLSVASESRIPKGGMYTSLFMQDALQGYGSYLQHMLGKYGVGQKGLALVIRQAGGFDDFIKAAGIGKAKKLLDKLLSDPDALLYSDEFPQDLYIRNRNPNMAGDIFTWLSWRLNEGPENLSMAKNFIRSGIYTLDRDGNPVEGIMLKQLRKKLGIPDDASVNFLEERAGVDYTKENPDIKDAIIRMTLEEIVIKNIMDYQCGHLSGDDRKKAEADIKNYLAEYGKWIGTGLRFETLRGKIESGDHEALSKGSALIQRMVELQPHRLFELSKRVRGRLSKTLGMRPQEIQDALEGLRFIEMNLINNCDSLLEQGKSFDGINGKYIQAEKVALDFASLVEEVEQMDVNAVFNGNQQEKDKAIAHAKKRQESAMKLYQAIQQDYTQNKSLYHDELMKYRKYNHGYVLWSGDAPIYRFDVSLLGPTGGFARRSRDNKANGEAIGLETGLIAGAKNNMTVNEVMNSLAGIHEKIAAYDSGKASQAVAEKAANIIELFRGQWYTDLPVVGQFTKSIGKGSLARKLWGSEAALWTKTEINHFIETLAHKEFINHGDAEKLMQKYSVNEVHVGNEVTIMMLQFAMIAAMLYIAQQLIKEETN